MGQRFLIQGGNKTRVTQTPITKMDTITPEEILRTAKSLGVDLKSIDNKELIQGAMHEAQEHPQVVTDIAKAIQVAVDHLKEVPDYYTRLKSIE